MEMVRIIFGVYFEGKANIENVLIEMVFSNL